MTIPDPDSIRAAHARIAPHIRRTPMLRTNGLIRQDIALKLEHSQVTGSFKVRGAFNNLLTRDVPETGVIATSGGNHGAALAYAATQLGHASEIHLPELIATEVKKSRMEGFGAKVVVAPGSVSEVLAAQEARAVATGMISVHPYDTAPTLAGQGTVAREIEKDAPDLDTLFVSVGGGGLIGGVAAWYQGRIKVVAVETTGTATLDLTRKHGPGAELAASGIAASGLGASSLGVLPLEVINAYVAENIVVTDADVFAAARLLWETTRLCVEPGAAVALAALISGAYTPVKGERLGVLLCGGNAAPDWFMD